MTMVDSEPKTVPNAACTACGCICDDIDLTVENNRISAAKNACPLGNRWFLNQRLEQRPVATIRGQPVSLEQAVEEAARILLQAKNPLVYGLSATSCEAQCVAVAIADCIGGCVDSATSAGDAASVLALQNVGEVTCTLGEVKNRADFVIYWGSNPAESHPRHGERYSTMPKGLFVPNGRQDRTVVIVDVYCSESVAEADFFLRIKPGMDFEALWALRALVQGLEIDAGVECQTGLPLKDLAQRMKTCKFGILFFGNGLWMPRGKHRNVEAALLLVRDLNEFTRFYAMPMRGPDNATGADNVMTWQTGYPFGVNLTRGYPRFNPGEFTAADMLARGEADAALIVASDPMSSLPRAARQHLAAMTYIALDHKESPTMHGATVAFTTATYGINVGGTVYRMDDVPIPLRPAFDSPFPSDEEVLRKIEGRVREMQMG